MHLLTLLTLCLHPSQVLASEMPENAESFDRGEATDRETKTLEEWMEEHGEALPPHEQRLPPRPTEELAPPPPPPAEAAPPPPQPPIDEPLPPLPGETASVPPTGEEFSGDLQPFTVTLVDKTLAQDVNYSVTGCTPNQSVDLLDNGIAPDTREGDGEYTAMSTLCPFGGTPVAIFEGDTPLWEENYQLPDNASAPSLRILRTTRGISIDTISDSSPPPSIRSPTATPTLEPTPSEPEDLPKAIWLLLGAGLGYAVREFQVRLQSKRSAPSENPPNAAPKQDSPPAATVPHPTGSVGNVLLEQTRHPTSLMVNDRLTQRSLTLSLAKHFASEGRVLLLPHPENQAFYPKQIPKKRDVIWFRGEPPRLEEIHEALSSPNSPFLCVLIEGLDALDAQSKQRDTIAEQLESFAAKRLIFIQLEEEDSVFEPSQWSLIQNHHWKRNV